MPRDPIPGPPGPPLMARTPLPPLPFQFDRLPATIPTPATGADVIPRPGSRGLMSGGQCCWGPTSCCLLPRFPQKIFFLI